MCKFLMSILFLCFWKKKDNLNISCSRDEGAPKGLLETVVFSDNMKKENNLSKYSGMDKETV